MGNNGWLVGDGEIVELIRSKDWSQTRARPDRGLAREPADDRVAVAGVLVPDQRDLGPRRRADLERGYSKVCGDKHPREFGSDYRECWASAWPAIGGAFETARAGETAFLENQPMFLDRNGYLEETWFTFSFSPIRDDTGQVVGPVSPGHRDDAADARRPPHAGAARPRRLRGPRAHACARRPRSPLEVLAGYRLDLPFLAALPRRRARPRGSSAHTGLRRRARADAAS